MDAIKTLIDTLYNSPHYAFGWVLLACLAVVPAIVSGNLVQHYLTKLGKGEITITAISKPLLVNFVILVVCVCVIAYAIYLYVIV